MSLVRSADVRVSGERNQQIWTAVRKNLGMTPGQSLASTEPAPRRRVEDGRRLRLLFALSFGPRLDNRHGGRVVAQLLARLTTRHDVAVVYLSDWNHRPIDPVLATRCALVRRVDMHAGWLPTPWRHRLNVLSTPLLGRPTATADVFSARFARALRETAEIWKPDLIQVEHDSIAYCAEALDDLRVPRVLVCHDPGLGASRDLAMVKHGRQRLAHKLDARSWQRQWRRVLPRFDAIVAFTRRDIEVLRPFAASAELVQIPLGIEIPPEPMKPPAAGEKNVLFIGGYSHLPNSDAAVRLIESIMPRVRRDFPGLPLLLVGHRPTEEMRRKASSVDAITGTVKDVDSFVEQASLLVLPIRLGGGMRVKLLEALAAGKAVVASPVAAAGLEVSDGQELVIAETDEEFAAAITRLVSDDAQRARLEQGAREWAVQHLSWDGRVERYEELYRSLLARDRLAGAHA